MTTPDGDTVDEILKQIQPGVRQDLVLSALELFSELGFDRTKTRDISAGANLSTGAMYVHFASKEEVLFEISRAGHRAVLGQVERCCQADGSSTERARDLLVRFVAWHARNAMTSRIIYREWSVLTDEHKAEILQLRRANEVLIADLIDSGVKAGEFHIQDPSIATLAVFSLGVDVSRWYGPGHKLAPEALGEGYAELAMRMLGVRAE